MLEIDVKKSKVIRLLKMIDTRKAYTLKIVEEASIYVGLKGWAYAPTKTHKNPN